MTLPRSERNVSLRWIVALQVAAWERQGIHVEDVSLGVSRHEHVHVLARTRKGSKSAPKRFLFA